jgi:uncharacterized phiE125 gp8 family phage protein
MTIVVFTAPASEPITLAEAKMQCRVDQDDEDELLVMLISATREHAETMLHRHIITQTLDAYFDEFPSEFKLPPLQSVTSITYVDTAGATQTLAADQYLVDAVSQPARIAQAYGVTWPATRTQNNAVKVRFVAGYGLPAAVPQCIKSWMLVRIATLFSNRQQIIIGPGGKIEIEAAFIDSLLDSERVHERT